MIAGGYVVIPYKRREIVQQPQIIADLTAKYVPSKLTTNELLDKLLSTEEVYILYANRSGYRRVAVGFGTLHREPDGRTLSVDERLVRGAQRNKLIEEMIEDQPSGDSFKLEHKIGAYLDKIIAKINGRSPDYSVIQLATKITLRKERINKYVPLANGNQITGPW